MADAKPRSKRSGKEPVKYKGSGSREAHSLVPNWLLFSAFMISFALPNLVFSGRSFFDTLHIMKWTVTMVPIGILALVAGVQLARHGAAKLGFVLDPFAVGWLLLVLLVTLQPVLINLSSTSTFSKEWFYFVCLFGTYILSYNLCKSKALHRAILWGGNVNAAINVFFAELLIRHLNSGYSFILDVPGNYIGNTAQQEMFGLWAAMAVLNSLFLHLIYVGETEEGKNPLKKPLVALNLFLLAINSWGLWSSTTRGAILSLLVAFSVLVITLWCGGQKKAVKSSLKLFGVVLAFMMLVLTISSFTGTGRGNALVSKAMDMVKNPTSFGSRISIWRTSWEVFLKKPVTGVGLGQYKWHFLDGQRIMFQKYPELLGQDGYSWQYTYWAHSEYIQWLCETGIIGALALFLLAAWWLYRFVRLLLKGERLPPEAIWGSAMLFMLWFDALFSRPFHRIENSVWMALAFAMANRSILPAKLKWGSIEKDSVYRGFGVLIAAIALFGFIFLAQGIRGDKLIYRTLAKQGGVLEKQDTLKKAESYLMSRDDAQEQLANLFIQVGKVQKNPDIFAQGVKNLYISFRRRPTAKTLFELLGYAGQFEGRELLNELTRYLNPDMLETKSTEVQGEPQSKE